MFGFGRKPAPAPPPIIPSPAQDVLDACQACDVAAAELARAVERRRRALVVLVAATPDPRSKALLNRLYVPYGAWRALAHHGLQDLLGLPQIPTRHRSGFTDAARAMVAATESARATRADPETEPADPGILEEV
ncbi:MAG: hypothetical protein ACHP7N_11315 [Caulobacterales bacterium]